MKEKKRETRRSKFVVSPQCIENSNHAHRHHHNAQLGRATQTDHSAAVAATDRELGRAGDGRSGESRRILTRRERGLASQSPGEREREREGEGGDRGSRDFAGLICARARRGWRRRFWLPFLADSSGAGPCGGGGGGAAPRATRW